MQKARQGAGEVHIVESGKRDGAASLGVALDAKSFGQDGEPGLERGAGRVDEGGDREPAQTRRDYRRVARGFAEIDFRAAEKIAENAVRKTSQTGLKLAPFGADPFHFGYIMLTIWAQVHGEK
jgi:hypothetical protein